MNSGKKNKKGKKIMPLAEFLGNKNVPEGFDKKVVNWADVTDENDDMGSMPPLPNLKEELILPTAPKAARANEIDTSRVPFNAPFKAYIGNIPYGATEDDLKKFFDKQNPVSVQLPRDDKGTGRTRGFGYVEFETRDNLIEALKMSCSYLNDRQIKVSLPDEGGRDGERRDRGYGNMGDEDRTAGDWRKAPRSEQSLPQHSSQYSSAPRPDMTEEMAGPWRRAGPPVDAGRRNGYDNPPTRSYEPAGGSYRESRYEAPHGDRPLGGAFSDRRTGGFDNFNRGTYSEDRRRDGGYDSSYNRDREPARQSSRYDDSNRSDRPSDRYDRASDYDRPPARSYDRPPARAEPGYGSEGPAVQPDEAPKTRPKLQLKPRTVPLEEIAAPAPVASKSIFGDAKPVDTMKKVLEVEKKLESLEVRDTVVPPDANRTRTVSSGSGSGSTSNRSRKESDTDRPARDEPKFRANEPRNFGPRDNEYNRRNDRPAPDRGYDSRYERRGPSGPGPHRTLGDTGHRAESRGYSDRPSGAFGRGYDRRDDRRDERGSVRSDDRRTERRPDATRERDNNNGVKQPAPKREPEYTMSNKYDALKDEEYDANPRFTAQD